MLSAVPALAATAADAAKAAAALGSQEDILSTVAIYLETCKKHLSHTAFCSRIFLYWLRPDNHSSERGESTKAPDAARSNSD